MDPVIEPAWVTTKYVPVKLAGDNHHPLFWGKNEQVMVTWPLHPIVWN